MAKGTKQTRVETSKRPTLLMPRTEVEAKLHSRIELGKQLLKLTIDSKESLDKAESEYRKWSDYNADMLRRVVDTDDLEKAYTPAFGTVSFGPSSLSQQVAEFNYDVKDKLERLESILNRLELIPEQSNFNQKNGLPQAKHAVISKRVFIVHGHDEEAKQSVARCVEKLGLDAVILHEQPNQGHTIIEKFENYSDVGFAVVLLTPDDVGSTKANSGNLSPRARQNVIFELGFFIGKLGRNRVCALHKGNVEFPSDFSGVLWLPMDTNGAWRFALGKEMRTVGIEVDLNKLA